jgi:uncharacterized protein (TIGR02001 family)
MLPALTEAGITYGLLGKLTSNYVYRGYSKSSGDPALQANFDVEHSNGFFGGAWISSVDFDASPGENNADIELSPYLGWGTALSNDWRVDTSLTGYIYEGDVADREIDYGEVSGQLYYRDLVAFKISLSHDTYGMDEPMQDYELLGRFPLSSAVDASGSAGYSHVDEIFGHDNLYWNLGATWFLGRYTAIDLRYFDLQELNLQSDYAPGTAFDFPSIENNLTFSISFGF